VSISVRFTVAGERAVLSLRSGDVTVSAESDATKRSIAAIAEEALEEYSPAMGGKGAHLAAALRGRVGAKIDSIDEPPAEKGRVY
jgi:hypothetical protein